MYLLGSSKDDMQSRRKLRDIRMSCDLISMSRAEARRQGRTVPARTWGYEICFAWLHLGEFKC